MRHIVLAGEHRFQEMLLSCFPAPSDDTTLKAQPAGLQRNTATPWAIAFAPWQEDMQETVRSTLRQRIPFIIHCDTPVPNIRDVERLRRAAEKRRIPTAVFPSLRMHPALARLREWVSAGVLGYSPSWTVFIRREQLQSLPLYVWVDAVWWTAGASIAVDVSRTEDGVLIAAGDDAALPLGPSCTSHSIFRVKGAGSESYVEFTGLVESGTAGPGEICSLHANGKHILWGTPAYRSLLAMEAAVLWASKPTPSGWGISMTLSNAGDAIQVASRITAED